jgi:hypothetical protein
VTRYDGDRLPLEHDYYGYHFRTPSNEIVWRYDCHDDHHELGTRFHIHDAHEDKTRAAGEVDLDEVNTLIAEHYGDTR